MQTNSARLMRRAHPVALRSPQERALGSPSPLTVFGQKGSGESGYLGAPAAIASAVNDAIRPLGIVVNSLPIKVAQLGDMIAAARERETS